VLCHISNSFVYEKQGCIPKSWEPFSASTAYCVCVVSAFVLNCEVPLLLRLHRKGPWIRKITSPWRPDCAAQHADLHSALPMVPCSFSVLFFLVKIPGEMRTDLSLLILG